MTNTSFTGVDPGPLPIPPQLQAIAFVKFHTRRTCERMEKALRDACFEVERPTQCMQDWPVLHLRHAIFGREWYQKRKDIADLERRRLQSPRHTFCFVGRSPVRFMPLHCRRSLCNFPNIRTPE